MVEAFRAGGGEGKPLYLQVHLSWAADEATALAVAHHQWSTGVLDPVLAMELHLPEQLDAAARFVSPEDVRSAVLVSADLGRHTAWLGEFAELGFDRLYLHEVGQAEHQQPVHRRLRRQGHPGPDRSSRRLGVAGGPGMSSKAAYDLWWKNAVIYCVDVELFADSDGDGVGDFPGLTGKVDYLAGLGVTCVWLMPFYPTPNKDNGYDISDFYGVDPRLGTLGDLVEFLRAARERGIRVIADLVVNHTSDQHPWFQSARADEGSPWRDFYVWADEQPEGPPGVVFPDAEDSNWDYDEVAGKWFLHRFYSRMPDLNIANPRVRDEICKVVGFWLELGLSGFRVDATPFVIELAGTEAERGLDPHAFLRDLRAFLNRRRGDAILLAEANLPPEEQRRFFGDEGGDEMHLLFNFVLNQQLFLALVRQDPAPRSWPPWASCRRCPRPTSWPTSWGTTTS